MTRKRKKPKGWRNEPGRHSLAARGVKTNIDSRDLKSKGSSKTIGDWEYHGSGIRNEYMHLWKLKEHPWSQRIDVFYQERIAPSFGIHKYKVYVGDVFDQILKPKVKLGESLTKEEAKAIAKRFVKKYKDSESVKEWIDDQRFERFKGGD